MTCNPEQYRKKMEAMRDAVHQEEHATVDGSRKRSEHMSHMAHMPMSNSYEEKMEKGQ